MSDGQSDKSGTGGGTALIVTRLNRVLALVMALVLFGLMALITSDVFGRYVFNTPIKGGFEIAQFMLGILIFLSLPLITWDNGHVTVSIFEGYFKRHFTYAQRIFVLLVSTASLAVITWRMWLQGVALQEGQQITGFLEMPIAPVAYTMSGLAAISLVLMVALLVMALMGRELPQSGPSTSA